MQWQAKEVNKVLEVIRINAESGSDEKIFLLYQNSQCPVLENLVQFCSPDLRKEIMTVKKVPRRQFQSLN